MISISWKSNRYFMERDAMANKPKVVLEHELDALKLEYRLATARLAIGLVAVVLITLVLSGTALAGKSSLLNGDQYVILVSVISAVILVYFVFIFGRILKLKAKISENVSELEVLALDKAG
jgi:hypothetical protein